MNECCTSKKPTVCFDAVGGPTTGEMLTYMGSGSTLLIYGALSGKPCSGIDALMMITQGMSIEGFWLNTFLEGFAAKPELREEFIQKVMPLYQDILASKI